MNTERPPVLAVPLDVHFHSACGSTRNVIALKLMLTDLFDLFPFLPSPMRVAQIDCVCSIYRCNLPYISKKPARNQPRIMSSARTIISRMMLFDLDQFGMMKNLGERTARKEENKEQHGCAAFSVAPVAEIRYELLVS
jgi:hypothetical protein